MTPTQDLRRLKYAVEACVNGVWGDEPNGQDDMVVVRVADFDRAKGVATLGDSPTIRAIPQSARNRRVLRPGDLLIEKSGGGEQQPVGNVVLFSDDRPAVCSNFVARMPVAGDCDSRFISYVFRSLYAEGRNVPHIKQTSGIQNLDSESYLNERAWLPEKARQERIANFLDERMARIDALIAEKENLLSASREYFTARLGTAVVTGLEANRQCVAAREKGFEEVRKDWELIPLKHIATFSGGMTPSKERPDFWVGDVPWVSPKDMKRFVLDDSTDHISHAALECTSLKLNPVESVLVVVRGMILAHTFPVALNAVPVTINQDMKALRAKDSVSAKYLAWMLRGLQPLMLSLTEESAHGTKALRTDQWANQCVPVPPAAEQLSLVAAFESWESESATLARHLETHISRLREYRSSLISAAVTGQLDISSFKESV